MKQIDHFSEEALRDLFESRIIKSKAVGLDGTRLEMFTSNLESEVNLTARKVRDQTYSFTSYREKLISKGAGRYPRQISIPTVRDRLALRAVCNCLSQIIPDARSRAPHSYIKAIAAQIAVPAAPASFLRIDVRDFFPSIQHEILLEKLHASGCESFLLRLIEGAITNSTGPRGGSKPRVKGVPQGLSISNILSSLYMMKFDEEQSSGAFYHRYVDDILMVESSHTITSRYKVLHAAMAELHLEPHPMGSSGKTEIRRIGEGVDYLGYHLLPGETSIRTSSYERMFANLSKVFTQYKYKKKLDYFLFKLNLRITGCIVDGKRKGWLLFFSQTDDISQLKFLDVFVEKRLRHLGVDPHANFVARFVKTYHEIRFKGVEGGYIPNFDSFTLAQQYQLLSAVTGIAIEELETRSAEVTEQEFRKVVAREVSDLEQDVLASVS